MSRLIYLSEVRDVGSGGVMKILDQARRGNKRTGLTGLLVFNRNYFLQCLEGGREEVTAVFCKIAADPRHGHVTLISVRDIDVRYFPDWTMSYLSSNSPELNAVLREFLPSEDFNPRLLSDEVGLVVMQRLQALERSV